MRTLLTFILLMACTWSSAQKGTLSWNDLERLGAMELTEFEKEMEHMGFSHDALGGATTPECVTLVYLGDEVTANGDRNKASTMRCTNGVHTVSYNTSVETDFTKMKEAAMTGGFKLQPEPGAAPSAQLYAYKGKQMRTDRSVANGVTYYAISYSGTWPK